ncbi:hypothetical protein HG535_0E01170 [Zygotorulaspora mrakii]|uniref:Uncharacterized protein n=1 Tax=Zygotorulaspora mrakii TaxID=42260 RepID=A0A7H9B3G4_ZYGMR|nr:uncharacterized protein HG535_0E01170 [Zygotorulaspora mrakii]QLG73033.1 hypothetical protein HG535_0E01170 [Zygotorulaspora mrakii]
MSSVEIVSPKRMSTSLDSRLSGASSDGKCSLGNKDSIAAGSALRFSAHRDSNETKEQGPGGAGAGGRARAKTAHKKTVITHGIQKNQKPKLRNKFASPTDRLLSPCSQKLNDHKSKLFVSKSNPTKLSFATKQDRGADDSDDEYA